MRRLAAPLTLLLTMLLFAAALLSAPKSARAMDPLKNEDPEKYYILLDLNNQIVTVYERDENGEYTKIVRQFLCTSGRTEIDPNIPEDVGTPTPRGVWKIGGRERFGKFANFGSEYARYWTQIVGSIYFHSIMFSNRTVETMKRGAFSKLGTNASHGCVRLYVEDAKWLYYYACPGTTIRVSTSEKSNKALRKALKTSLSFKEYNALQKEFYDEPELPNPTCYVTVENARLRKGCGSDFDSVCKVPVGESMEVLLEGDAWVKVRYGKREGYVRRGYISMVEGEMDTREDATLIRETVWLQAEPKSSSEDIVKVPADTSVKVLETLDTGWTKIEYWNETGYVRTSRLRTGWGKDMG